MRTKGWLAVSAFTLAGAAGQSMGQISRVDPFVGSHQEGFEAVPSYACPPCFFACLNDIFGDTATICDSSPGGTGMHITSGWGFMCTIAPHAGGRLFGSAGGPPLITFDDVISKFGGYFGTNSGSADGVIEFFDANGLSLGTMPITIPADCTWTWNGWESTSPNIKSVKITGNNPFGGGFVMMDDLEYDRGGGGGPVCYPDCNQDHALNVNDFVCFQGAFAGGNMAAADCDQNNALNVNDFVCFQSAFAAGCSQL